MQKVAASNGRDEVTATVVAVFDEAQRSGRAVIRISAEGVEVLPVSTNACVVSVFDSAPQIDLLVGRDPFVAVHELWHDDRQSNLDRLRELLEAIRDGRHARTVETFKRDRLRITDRFDLLGGTEEYSTATTASGHVDSGRSVIERFEPY
jgi:hypothetical protein